MNVTKKLMDEHQLIIKYISLLELYLTKIKNDRKREDLFVKLGDFCLHESTIVCPAG